jgi:large subunit ribosomal protein L15
MKLNELSPEKGSRKSRKRLGRGPASGTGKTAGRGTKGHKSRSGGGVRPGFEGGQMPIQRRLPKRGFTNIFKKDVVIINLRDLQRFESGAVVDKAALITAGLLKRDTELVKLLGHGKVEGSYKIQLDMVSNGAREKVLAAGGSIED